MGMYLYMCVCVGDAEGVLMEFKQWFEDDSIRKVWHTYGYDRHVLNNEGMYVHNA